MRLNENWRLKWIAVYRRNIFQSYLWLCARMYTYIILHTVVQKKIRKIAKCKIILWLAVLLMSIVATTFIINLSLYSIYRAFLAFFSIAKIIFIDSEMEAFITPSNMYAFDRQTLSNPIAISSTIQSQWFLCFLFFIQHSRKIYDDEYVKENMISDNQKKNIFMLLFKCQEEGKNSSI